MNEIYVKELPKCCAECDYKKIDTNSMKKWTEYVCSVNGVYNNAVPNFIGKNCPLRTLDANDKQVRADTAREIIEKLNTTIRRNDLACGFDWICAFSDLSKELSEQYKEGE